MQIQKSDFNKRQRRFWMRRATVLNDIYDNEPPPRLFNSAAVNNLTKKTYLKLNR